MTGKHLQQGPGQMYIYCKYNNLINFIKPEVIHYFPWLSESMVIKGLPLMQSRKKLFIV